MGNNFSLLYSISYVGQKTVDPGSSGREILKADVFWLDFYLILAKNRKNTLNSNLEVSTKRSRPTWIIDWNF